MDRKPNEKANFKACFQCHKPHAQQDFVISYPALAGRTMVASPAPAAAGAVPVNIAAFAFGPGQLTVETGKPVVWTNSDLAPHQVTFTKTQERSPILVTGQSHTQTFATPGVYDYICGPSQHEGDRRGQVATAVDWSPPCDAGTLLAPQGSLVLLPHGRARAVDARRWHIACAWPAGMLTIVIAEDEPNVVELVRVTLEDDRVRVVAAPDGTSALELAARLQPGLVLLDVGLPDVDGVEVCRRLRLDPSTAATPIVMLTAAAQQEDVTRGLAAGATVYLTKPFSPVRLLSLVEQLLPDLAWLSR